MSKSQFPKKRKLGCRTQLRVAWREGGREGIRCSGSSEPLVTYFSRLQSNPKQSTRAARNMIIGTLISYKQSNENGDFG